MAERLTFTLEGRDQLSRVLGHAGESADRLRASMEDAADGSGQAILTLTQDADGRLRDLEGRFISAADAAALMAHRTGELQRPTTSWADAAEAAGKAGEALKKALITLAPAAIPAAASLAPIAPAVLAGAAAAGVFALAVGAQVSAMSDAVEAEKKYTDAVEQNGAASEQAVKAQVEYARQVAKLPPATRQAAAALSVFKDEYKEWSDSLATDTMGPVVKGLAVMQGILPKLTPMVKGFAGELDRTVTLAAGGVASPGFDAFAKRMGAFSTGVLDRANDALVTFLRTLDTREVGQGVGQFLDWARQQGPVVGDILRNLGQALGNILEGASETGVSLLQVVGVLAELAASVPPEMIGTLLQLAIAIKAVNLAVAGGVAARTAIAALGTQLVAMRTAAAAAPGPLAAAGAAITSLSRTAKLAIAGTGIGLLVIALSELSANSQDAPPDVDKLTASLKQLGATGQVTGTALAEFGKDFGELSKLIGEVISPSVVESINNWGADITGGFLDAGAATEEFNAKVGSIDKALASLVSAGNADLAAAALGNMLKTMDPARADKLRSSLNEYDTAVENMRFEQELAADAMGIYGQQAQATTAKLDAQKQSADGLRQALFALSNVNRAATSAMSAYQASIDNVDAAIKDNGKSLRMVNGELDLNSDKARAAEAALRDMAAKAEEAAAAADEQGKSNAYVNGILEDGRRRLIANSQQLGLNRQQAEQLARTYLGVPDKTAKLRGNIEDLQAKVAAAKKQLANVPDGRKAQIRANITQLEGEIWRAKQKLAGIPDESVGVSVFLKASSWDQDANGIPDAIQSRASGGMVGFPGGGAVRGPGTSTSDSILTRLSNGEYVVRAAAVVKYGQPFLDAVNSGQLDVASAVPAAGMAASVPSPGRAAVGSGVAVTNNYVTVTGAVDPVSTAKQIRTLLLKDKRTNGGKDLGLG